MSMIDTYKVLMECPYDNDVQRAFERSINKQEVIMLIKSLIEERKKSEEYKKIIDEVISISGESAELLVSILMSQLHLGRSCSSGCSKQ